MKLKDNKIYRWIIIPLCIALSLFGKFIPTNNVLTMDGMGVICIFVSSLILWLTIGIDWPSILCIFSLGFLDTLGFTQVFKLSFGNSTWIFLIFTFICTYALSKTSLIKRIALFFINLKIAKKNTYTFICFFLIAVLLLGLFISPTVLFVIILPILKKIFELTNIEKGDKIAKVLMMGLGFTISISSGMTPIAHVFPILAFNAANIEMSPILYMGVAIPTGLIIFIIMLLIFRMIKLDKNKLKNVNIEELKCDLEPINKKDIITLIIFIIVIILWIIPSLFKDVSIDFYNAINKYGTAMPPILGVLLLSIIRIDNKPLIEIGDAFKNGVPWANLMMCAATLVLGSALMNDSIGIKNVLQNTLGNSLNGVNEIILLIIFIAWASLQTNLSSNMVTATLVASIAASVLGSISSSSLSIVSVIALIGMNASFAFATPPSMPHIAIIAGSEYCDTKTILIYGSILMLVAIVISILIGYPLGMVIL